MIMLEHGVKLTRACCRRITEDVVGTIRAVSAGRGHNLVVRVQVINRGGLQRLLPDLAGQNAVVVILFLLDSLLRLDRFG